MLNASILFALLCVLGLLLFFSGLPTLSTCALPSIVSDHSGQSFKRPLESVLVILVTAIYAFAAFWNLGNRQSPQSFISMAEKAAVLEMDTPEDAGRLALFPGIGSGSYRIEYSVDAEGWFPLESFLQDHVAVLKWAFIPLNLDDSVRYLRIICDSGSPWLGEVALLAPDGTRLPFHTDVILLCDEPDTVPTASDFLNSSYFDEIYHVRTAWEHLNGIWPYWGADDPRHVSLCEAAVFQRQNCRPQFCSFGLRIHALCTDKNCDDRQLCRVLHPPDVLFYVWMAFNGQTPGSGIMWFLFRARCRLQMDLFIRRRRACSSLAF